MHSNHKNSKTTTSSDENRRKKRRLQLSTRNTTRLGSINEILLRNVRKSHCTTEPQVISDKQLYREKDKEMRRKSKIKNKKVDDSSSLISRVSSNTNSSSSTSSKGQISSSSSPPEEGKESGWKVKKIYSKKRKDDIVVQRKDGMKKKIKKRASTRPPLPVVIDVDESSDLQSTDDYDDNDFHSDNSSPSSSSSESTGKATLSNSNNTKQPTTNKLPSRSMRPPRPPSNGDRKSDSNGSKKQSALPAWLVALREKQKLKKKEEKFKNRDDDDDNGSVRTVDLEKSAEDAIGKQSIISLFGKKVSLVSKPKPKPSQKAIELNDGNPSPWAVKLKPVNRKSMTGDEIVPRQLLSTSPSLEYANQSYCPSPSPAKSNNEEFSEGSRQNSTSYNISPGDIIDLSNLPKPAFENQDKTIIFPITNNNDNRSQIVVLGEEMLLIASRCLKSGSTDSLSDRANVLWFTPRSQIVSLGLNNKADGVSVSIESGESFPLDFESCPQCFSFIQTYYNYNQSQSHKESDDAFTTPTSNRANHSGRFNENYLNSSQDSISELGGASSMIHSQSSDLFLTPTVVKRDIQLSPDAEATTPCHVSSGDSDVNMTMQHDSNLQHENDHQNEEEQKESSKINIANMLQSHFAKRLSVSQSDASDIKNEERKEGDNNASKENISNMLNSHLKQQKDGNDAKKGGIASMLEGHFKKQLGVAQSPMLHHDENLPVLTEEEETTASKYRKMIKVGMPIEAVSHAMKRDQVSEKIVAAVTKDDPKRQSSVTTELWTKEEECTLNRFRKMLKLNLSKDKVRNKMVLDNVDNKIIEAVVGKAEPPAQVEASNSEKPEQLSNEEETKVEKYKKMMKMGIPSDAVRHAMCKDNVDRSIIDKLLGADPSQTKKKKEVVSLSEEEKKEVERYKKMLKVGLPEPMVRHKMASEGASAKVISFLFQNESTSSSVPSEDLKRKTSGLVNIYWEKLSKDQVENQQSIWSRSAKKPKLDAHNIDLDTLQELFKKPPREAPKRTLASKDNSNGNKMARILDMKRTQNVSISLQAFKKFSLDELVEIISDLDPVNSIKGDCVLFLKGLFPEETEIDAISKYKGEDKWLSNAELLFRKLCIKLQSVANITARIKDKTCVIITMETFNQTIEHVMCQFETLIVTCNGVIQSGKLQLVLESVLTIGNIMNEGTSSGDAVGIKFNSLLKLTDTKSKDRKMSVLDYIVMMFIEKNQRDVTKLLDDFPQCVSASRILITDLDTQFTTLESSLKKCKTELFKLKTEQQSQGSNYSTGLLRLQKFMENSQDALSRLQETREQASKACEVSLNEKKIL